MFITFVESGIKKTSYKNPSQSTNDLHMWYLFQSLCSVFFQSFQKLTV